MFVVLRSNNIRKLLRVLDLKGSSILAPANYMAEFTVLSRAVSTWEHLWGIRYLKHGEQALKESGFVLFLLAGFRSHHSSLHLFLWNYKY